MINNESIIIKGNIVRYFLQYAIFSPLIKYLPFDLPVELWPKFYLDLLLSVDLLFDIWHTFWPTFLLLPFTFTYFLPTVSVFNLLAERWPTFLSLTYFGPLTYFLTINHDTFYLLPYRLFTQFFTFDLLFYLLSTFWPST